MVVNNSLLSANTTTASIRKQTSSAVVADPFNFNYTTDNPELFADHDSGKIYLLLMDFMFKNLTSTEKIFPILKNNLIVSFSVWFKTFWAIIGYTVGSCAIAACIVGVCIYICMRYRFPYCQQYVRRWFQDPDEAAVARYLLWRAVCTHYSCRPRRVRPREIQVSTF